MLRNVPNRCLTIFSSDLWVEFDGNMPNANNTGVFQHAIYGIGSITGPVKQADVDFAGISVKNQAFSKWRTLRNWRSSAHCYASVQVASKDNHGTNFHGLIGLGTILLFLWDGMKYSPHPRI
jgi:hypothetical protein